MDSNNNYTVELTDDCKKDIRNIYSYIRYNLETEDAANKLIEKVENVIVNLTYFPKIYTKINKY